jgi:hypothetical protein
MRTARNLTALLFFGLLMVTRSEELLAQGPQFFDITSWQNGTTCEYSVNANWEGLPDGPYGDPDPVYCNPTYFGALAQAIAWNEFYCASFALNQSGEATGYLENHHAENDAAFAAPSCWPHQEGQFSTRGTFVCRWFVEDQVCP